MGESALEGIVAETEGRNLRRERRALANSLAPPRSFLLRSARQLKTDSFGDSWCGPGLFPACTGRKPRTRDLPIPQPTSITNLRSLVDKRRSARCHCGFSVRCDPVVRFSDQLGPALLAASWLAFAGRCDSATFSEGMK